VSSNPETAGTVGTLIKNNFRIRGLKVFPLEKTEWEHVGTVGTRHAECSHSERVWEQIHSMWEHCNLFVSRRLQAVFPLFPLFPLIL
jgi:hypothetical protein